jgi:hypothetical protein
VPRLAPQLLQLAHCTCATAAGADGPDGIHCSWCGCGSAVGHTLGHAITGGFSGDGNAEPSRPDITHLEPKGIQPQPAQQQPGNPCFYEIK